MKAGNASGTQIALLLFTVVLLAVPASSFLAQFLAIAESQRDLLGRLIQFGGGALILLAVPPLRRAAARLLASPIPASSRLEVAIAAAARIPLTMAISGTTALWIWISEGNAALDARMRPDPMAELAYAFSPEGMVFFLIMGALIAPVLEEIVFRGFLYRAWERRWGWIPAMLGVSALFALYHRSFASAFVSSVLFVCLFRRTGSLWAPIVVHAAGNIALWYPIAGHLLRPSPERAIGDITSWSLQLGCLFVAAIALPFYVWMSRDRPMAETVVLER